MWHINDLEHYGCVGLKVEEERTCITTLVILSVSKQKDALFFKLIDDAYFPRAIKIKRLFGSQSVYRIYFTIKDSMIDPKGYDSRRHRIKLENITNWGECGVIYL